MTTCLRCDHPLSQHTRPLSDLLGCTAGGCNCVREVAGVTGPEYPCLPSLGEHCGQCHRCTPPAASGPEVLPLHRTEANVGVACSTCDDSGCPDCTDPA